MENHETKGDMVIHSCVKLTEAMGQNDPRR